MKKIKKKEGFCIMRYQKDIGEKIRIIKGKFMDSRLKYDKIDAIIKTKNTYFENKLKRSENNNELEMIKKENEFEVFKVKNKDALFRYKINIIEPEYVCGASSEFRNLREIYNKIFKLANEYDIKSFVMPVIGEGENTYPFEIAAKIALATISNCLIKNDKIENIYLEISSGAKLETINKIKIKFDKISAKKRRIVDIDSLKSQQSYLKEVWFNDSKQRNIFGITLFFRIILTIIPFISLGFYIQYLTGKHSWNMRRNFIDIQVFIKSIIPILLLYIDKWQIFCFILIIYMLIETVIYISSIIFLADIKKPSANNSRSIILLFFNVMEINFSFAFLYKFFNIFNDKTKTILDYLHFSFINSTSIPENWVGKFLTVLHTGLFIYIVGIALVFFTSNFTKNRYIE